MANSKLLLKRLERCVKKNVKRDMFYQKKIKRLNKDTKHLVSKNERLSRELDKARQQIKSKNVVTSAMLLGMVSTNDRLTKMVDTLKEPKKEEQPLVKEIHCERNTVENTYTVVFLTVLLLFTYPFVRLSCYAATSHSHSVSMSEETNQVISMNVVGFQIMFTVVCYFIFNT